MIEAVKEQNKSYISNFSALQSAVEGNEPGWLTRLRKAAMLRFEEKGFPTTKDEEWKYTDISAIKKSEFELAPSAQAPLSVEEINTIPFADLKTSRIVFWNGHFQPELSTSGALPGGARVSHLKELLVSDAGFLESHLNQYVRWEDQVLNALNLAFLQDGAVIHVPRGVVVEEPIHLLFLTGTEETPLMVHPRVLIVAEENSQVSIAESHIGISGRYWSNGVTEIIAGENAVVDHYKLQKESNDGYHTATVQSYQSRMSSVTTTTVSLSGAIIRNETNSALDGEGCWSELNGLFLVSRDQHIDNFTQLEHLKPNCSSREHYKGILDDRSQGVFRGRIVVAKDAQKTDSKQTNNNLLLSDDALINTKPQLEIYADDVKCTHGATIGQLDRDAVFYLRSRGIDKKAARSILIYAFASEMVGRIKLEELAQQLDNYLFEWLPRGELVRETV